MVVPVIERIAPELAGLGEIIRRHSGHDGRITFVGQAEELGVCPHFGAVQRYEDRDVADDADVACIRVRLYAVPLNVEQVLQKAIVVDLVLMCAEQGCFLMRSRVSELGRPLQEAHAVLHILADHEESIVVQPVLLAFAEFFELHFQDEVFTLLKVLVGTVEDHVFVVQDVTVIHGVVREVRKRLQVLLQKKTLRQQYLRTDEQRLSGKCGKTLVR